MIRKAIAITMEGPMTRTWVAEMVQTASRYSSRIMLEYGSRIVNVKSTLGLLSLTSDAREGLTLLVDGPDEDAAVETIVHMKDIQEA